MNKLAKDVLAAFDAIYTTNQTLVLDKKLPNFNTTDQQVKQLELDKDKLLKKIEQLKAQKVVPKTVSNKTELNQLKAENKKLLAEIEQLKNANKQQEEFNDLFEDLLEKQLLTLLKKMSPTAFEKFSLELIKSIAKERGGEVEVFHNGQVGDGGVDGIIESERTFGRSKQRVFVQCKRYDKTAIGRPEMQAFAGAMLVEKIHTAIFITTSYFSKQAEGYVEELHQKLDISIELFNGQKIVEHMIKNKIALIEKVTVENQIDESYFSQFES